MTIDDFAEELFAIKDKDKFKSRLNDWAKARLVDYVTQGIRAGIEIEQDRNTPNQPD